MGNETTTNTETVQTDASQVETKTGDATSDTTQEETQPDYKALFEAEKAKNEAAKIPANEEPDYKALFEAEKAKADATAKEQTISTAISTAVADSLTRAKDPKALALLMDRSKLSVENGVVKGLEAEVARLQKEFPGQFYSAGTVVGSADAKVETEYSTPSARMSAAYATNAEARRGR